MKSLQSMLDLVSGYTHVDEIRKLYESVDKILQEEFKTLPLLVYSKYLYGVKKGQCRLHWNKNSVKESYQEKELDDILELMGKQDETLDTWEVFKSGESCFYGSKVGQVDNQYFFCVWKVDSDIPVEFMNYLSRFIQNSHEMFQKWKAFEKAQDLIYKDDVTGLFNQRRLMKDLDTCIQNFKDYKQKFCVLFIDIDHFKSVNDGHGHLVGTQFLKDVGEVIMDTVRTSDYLYRYGGDEFVIILPDEDIETGKVVGERILENVKDNKFRVKKTGEEKNITVSIGVATFPEHAGNREEILYIADMMMYEAKNTGRGKVSPADEVLAKKMKEQAK
ncbi:MAG: GGDEF domain-containing protein [Bacteriovoracaceae bacterium]|nr:GGDEF domain-containing protein [Bacteriovoracaceae bacterium]